VGDYGPIQRATLPSGPMPHQARKSFARYLANKRGFQSRSKALAVLTFRRFIPTKQRNA
jgi:hypothetical protein